MKKKKQEKQMREIKFSTKRIRSIVSFLFYLVMISSLFFNVLFFTKYQTIRDTVKTEQENVQNYLDGEKKKTNLESASVEVFAKDFLEAYLTIPEKEQYRETHKKTLEAFFVRNFAYSDENVGRWKGWRNVESVEMVNIDKESKELAFVTCRAVVKTKNATNPKHVKESTEKVEYMIPITSNQKGFAVTDYPSLISTNLKADIERDSYILKGEDISANIQDELTVFAEKFFESYGVSDEKLELMTTEKGLIHQKLQQLEIKQMVITDAKEHLYKMQVSVDYVDSDTNLPIHLTYILELRRDSTNNYYVLDIK
ncbi:MULTISPECIES: conjugal transfer protein [Listeria]|uniref:conjugal transfer protein n=1 Tax=Listeria TaxID=1637 RepID=UPI000B589F33|nr:MULTISPECIES: conjugal transfer protein [Listeria]